MPINVKMVAKEVQWWYWCWGYVLFIPHPNCGGIAANSFMMIYYLQVILNRLIFLQQKINPDDDKVPLSIDNR